MRWNYTITALLLLHITGYSAAQTKPGSVLFMQPELGENSVTARYSNEHEAFANSNAHTRTIDFPTQIIRMSAQIDAIQVTCEQVHREIEQRILAYITRDKFIYSTFIGCTYDPATYFAKSFIINSYFDPINDEAVAFLKNYLVTENGSDFLGTPLNIESAKGLIISLNLAAGTKTNPKNPPFVEFKKDRSTLYFPNNFDMNSQLFRDIFDNFFSNKPDKILPFLDKWLYAHAGMMYKAVLRDANYVELQPERIFVMRNGEEVFVSKLKYYFAHDCLTYENQRCLPYGV